MLTWNKHSAMLLDVENALLPANGHPGLESEFQLPWFQDGKALAR